jgi:phospholipid/cholesterol/gamma-HCH transport system substrate-binding protein
MTNHRKPGTRTPASWLKRIALVLVGIVGLACCVAVTTGNAPATDRTVVAEFADASPLLVGNDVKVDGVRVGTVTGLSVVDGHANVAFTVSSQALPLHTDASVEVRPVSLLGERYLDLNRGGAAALVTVLGQGIQGNGGNVAATIRALAPAMTDTDGLLRILDQQNSTLNSLVDNVTPVGQALAQDNGKTMNSLVDSANQLFGTTATNQQALQAVLTQLPSTLTSARTTLAQLTGTANAATPTLAAIRPTVDNLNAISQELEQFSAAADPALAHAEPVLQQAQTLLDAARPVADDLLQAGPALPADASSIKPLTTDLSDNINHVMNFIRGWALSTNGVDGLSHYFRAITIITPNILSGMLPGGGPQLPGVPVLGPITQQPAPSGPPPSSAPPLSGLSGILGGLLPPSNTPDGGVTGLNPRQEGGALQFLLGGGA